MDSEKSFKILSKRLKIREFTYSDVENLNSILADKTVMKYGNGIKNESEISDWILVEQGNYSKLGYGLWAISEKKTESFIGYCGLTLFPDICGESEIEIGYRLATSYWGKGYATEASKAVIDFSSKSLELNRLIALVDPGNLASINVAKKIGMTFEKEAMLPGYDYPDHVYSMVIENLAN